MGHAEYDRKWIATGTPPQQQIWPSNACMGFAPPPAFASPRFRERTANGPGDASRAQPDEGLRFRRRRCFAQGFVCISLALAPQQWNMGYKESGRNPSGASRPGKVAADAQRF